MGKKSRKAKDIDIDLDDDSFDDDDDDFNMSEDPSYDNDDLKYSSDEKDPEYVKDLNAIDRIFNVENFLHHIRMTLLGHKIENGKYVNTGEGLMTSHSINKVINSMRSVVSATNILSSMDDDMVYNHTMLSLNKEVIFAQLDDISVEGADIEHITNIVDHSISLFLGIIRGDGVENAKQILTTNYENLRRKEDNYDPAFRFGTSNTDFIAIGGNRNGR